MGTYGNPDDSTRALLFYLKTLGRLPTPQAEYRFHPTRRWRFDLAWPDQQPGLKPGETGGVAVELDGGAYSRGRHVRGAGFERDLEKLNAAAELGWVVLRYTPQMVERDPTRVVGQIREVLAARVRSLMHR